MVHVVVVANRGGVPHVFVADAVPVAAVRPIAEEPTFTPVEPRHRGHDGNADIFKQARCPHGLEEPARSVGAVDTYELGNVSMRKSLTGHRRGQVHVDLLGYHHFGAVDCSCRLSEPLMLQDAIYALD